MLDFLNQTVWEVKGHEEYAYERRPNGAEVHEAGPGAKNWLELVSERLMNDLHFPRYDFLIQMILNFSERKRSSLNIPTLPFSLSEEVKMVL